MTRFTAPSPRTIPVGTTVYPHCATPEWRSGDREGVVIGRAMACEYVTPEGGREVERPYRVRLSPSGRVARFHPTALFTTP